METRENIASENSATSSIQDDLKLDVDENKTSTDNIFVPNRFIYNLIEKQAKEFEEFGKRMSLDLQNSYKEYLVQPNENIKVEKDPIEIEKVCKKYEEKIIFQTQLIDSLKTRIEELETDSIIKDQDIKNLRQEINDFKKEIQSVLGAPALDNKKNVSLNRNENDKDLETPDQFNESLACDEMFGYNEKKKSNHLESIEEYPQCQQEPYILPVSVKHIYNKNEQIHNEVNKFLDKHKNRTTFKNKTFSYLLGYFNTNSLLEYEKSELFKSLSNDIKRCIKLITNEALRNELSSKKKKKLSQPINVYVARTLIPSLPAGVKSYSEFRKTSEYDLLSSKMKKRIKKVISVENK